MLVCNKHLLVKLRIYYDNLMNMCPCLCKVNVTKLLERECCGKYLVLQGEGCRKLHNKQVHIL